MTCIVGFADKGKIWIGGDSAGIGGYSKTIRADTKVFVRGEFLYGYTTSFRMGQLLRYKLAAPKHPADMCSYEYLCTLWIDEVRKCLKEGGFTTVQHNHETGGTFLLGYRGCLYQVDSDFQVGIPANGMAAVGCGADLALGALYVSRGHPRARLIKALEAAAEFSAGVARPFVVDCI